MQQAIEAVGMAIGALYFCGFVVVNTHLSRFGAPSFALVRARYVAAGALYAFTTAVPLAAGASFWREMASIPNTPKPDLYVLPGSVVLFGGLILLWFVTYPLKIQPRWLANLSYSERYYYIGLIVVGAIYSRSIVHGWPESFSALSFGDVARAVGIPMILFGSLRAFAIVVYPQLSPAFGGGGAWLASVSLKSTIRNAELESIVSTPIVVLESDNRFLRFIGFRGQRRIIAALDLNEVLAIEFRKMVDVATALNADEPSRQRRPYPRSSVRAARSMVKGAAVWWLNYSTGRGGRSVPVGRQKGVESEPPGQ